MINENHVLLVSRIVATATALDHHTAVADYGEATINDLVAMKVCTSDGQIIDLCNRQPSHGLSGWKPKVAR